MFAGSILAFGISTASFAQEPQVWQGEAFITGYQGSTAESACSAVGVASIGDFYLTIYRPIIPGSPNNPTSSDEGLTLFGARNGVHYFTADGVSFAKPGKAFIAFLSSLATFEAQTATPATIPFDLKISPKKITLKTQTVSISGSLDDFDNVTGCDVTFTAALDLRVD
jgi:hypothetical protein